MTPIPEQVRVGPHVYEIRADRQTAAMLRENGSRAETRADRCLVLLDPDIGPRAESLLHELLHCAWNLTSLRVTEALDEHEESVVTSLAPLILGMLRDNPDLVRFLVNDRRPRLPAGVAGPPVPIRRPPAAGGAWPHIYGCRGDESHPGDVCLVYPTEEQTNG